MMRTEVGPTSKNGHSARTVSPIIQLEPPPVQRFQSRLLKRRPASKARALEIAPLEPCPEVLRQYLQENYHASLRFIAAKQERDAFLLSHDYWDEGQLCVDGRVGDFPEAMGLPEGIMEVYRAAGAKSDLRNLGSCARTLASIRKASKLVIGDETKRMVRRRMMTVHYSRSRPETASCAALKHDTAKGLRSMIRASDKLNRIFPGSMVAFPALIDTDFDAVTIIGPGDGRLDVYDLLYTQELQPEEAFETVVRQLRDVFPRNWSPLRELSAKYRESFHHELAERVVANMRFVKRVQESGRVIELLNHQERMIFVGRHSRTVSHNSIFLIDDTESDLAIMKAFEIALKYVALNTLHDAIREENPEPRIPVIINVPHEDDDRLLQQEYVRGLKQKLLNKLTRCAGAVADFLLESDHGLKQYGPIPKWLELPVRAFESLVVFCTTVSAKSTRLYVPFT